MKKGRQFFSGKNGVTPSVAVPGDTNPSDATVSICISVCPVPVPNSRATGSRKSQTDLNIVRATSNSRTNFEL